MKKLFAILTIAVLALMVIPSFAQFASFRFVSIGDGQGDATRLASTLAQVTTVNPAFVLFNGDLENNGFAELRCAGRCAIYRDDLQEINETPRPSCGKFLRNEAA